MALLASLVATVVGGRFSLALWRQWDARGRRSRALLHWAISTAMFAVASLMLLGSELIGWSSFTFRVFYAFGAVLNVPWLALGSVLVNGRSRGVTRAAAVAALLTGLLFLPAAIRGEGLAIPGALLGLGWGGVLLQRNEDRVARGSLVILGVLAVVGLGAVFLAGFRGPLPTEGIPEGKVLFPALVRGLAVGGNAIGALVVVVGALASSLSMAWGNTTDEQRRAFRLRLRRAPVEAVAQVLFEGIRAAREAGLAHLASGNLLIALGVLVAAGSGGMFSFLGDTAGHAVGLGAGVAVMYAGFARTLRSPELAAARAS